MDLRVLGGIPSGLGKSVGANIEREESLLDHVIKHLEEEIVMLNDRIENLDTRLIVVSSDKPAQPSKDVVSPPSIAQAPIIECLNTIIDRITALRKRVCWIIEKLDI